MEEIDPPFPDFDNMTPEQLSNWNTEDTKNTNGNRVYFHNVIAKLTDDKKDLERRGLQESDEYKGVLHRLTQNRKCANLVEARIKRREQVLAKVWKAPKTPAPASSPKPAKTPTPPPKTASSAPKIISPKAVRPVLKTPPPPTPTPDLLLNTPSPQPLFSNFRPTTSAPPRPIPPRTLSRNQTIVVTEAPKSGKKKWEDIKRAPRMTEEEFEQKKHSYDHAFRDLTGKSVRQKIQYYSDKLRICDKHWYKLLDMKKDLHEEETRLKSSGLPAYDKRYGEIDSSIRYIEDLLEIISERRDKVRDLMKSLPES